MKTLKLSIATLILTGTFAYADGEVEVPTTKRMWNVGLKGGTLGAGIDVSTMINEKVGVRINLNTFNYNTEQEIDGINYDGSLELMTVGALVDYYPFAQKFRLTGGVYYNDNALNGSAVPTTAVPVNINGTDYAIDDIGKLDAKLKFNKVSPYIGFGWGSDTHKKGLGFSLDAGAMYHGEPDLDLDVTINDPAIATTINSDVESEKASAQDDVKNFKFYPVVMLGVNYRF